MNQLLQLKKLKTLFIDDDVVIRDTMQMFFTKKGCLLKAFETAEEGLQALERERFDIIISDFQLPGINGVEFFKRVMVSYPDTIKILISGYGNEYTASEAFEIGVHAFIKKPFTLTTFLEQVMPYVKKHHDRITQSHDSAHPGAELENSNRAQTAGNKIMAPGFQKQSTL